MGTSMDSITFFVVCAGVFSILKGLEVLVRALIGS